MTIRKTPGIRRAKTPPLAPRDILLKRTSFAIATLLLFVPTFNLLGQTTHERNDADQNQFEQLNLGFENAPDQVVDPLLEQLGDPDFETREAAAKALKELGPAAFTRLARHYSDHDDYEVRLRIEDIVKDQYVWHTLLKHKGFMGVRYSHYTGPPLLPGQSGFLIGLAEPGHAAHDAGIRGGDIIVSLDGMSAEELSDLEFAAYIQKKGAGGTLTVRICVKDPSRHASRTVEKTLTLKARPIDQYVNPELLEELNSRMQSFSLWWDKHFSVPRKQHNRLPTSEVLQIPE